MIILLLLLTSFAELKEEIRLDNLRMFIPNLTYNRVYLENDGTFLLSSRYHIWHWDQSGKLINRMGGKGQGPGEFIKLSQVLWTGKHYWVIDGDNLMSSVYDAKGNYLYRTPLYFRQFVRTEDQLFTVDLNEYRWELKNKPRSISEINYNITDTELTVKTGARFKKVTPKQFGLKLNFKLVWVVPEGDGYLVVDQLENKVLIYDQKTIAREAKVSDDDFFEPKSFILRLDGWVDPPDRFLKKKGSGKDFVEWWMAWSRINYFSRVDDGYLVAYEMPDPENPAHSKQVVQRVDARGVPNADPLISEGFIAGIRKNKVYIMVEGDNDEDFEYFMHVWEY